MARKGFTPEQIVATLRQIEVAIVTCPQQLVPCRS